MACFVKHPWGVDMTVQARSKASGRWKSQSPTVQSRLGRKAVRAILLALCLGVVSVQSGAADPARLDTPGPDTDDLRLYLACASASNERMLGFNEAIVCSDAFQRIKLSFFPGVTPEEFALLPPREQSALSIEGYLRYRAWIEQNRDRVSVLDDKLSPALGTH
jgi:hypothetical protein